MSDPDALRAQYEALPIEELMALRHLAHQEVMAAQERWNLLISIIGERALIETEILST